MPRGKRAKPGDRKINQNGYEYIKQEDGTWRGSHIVLMEAHLDRRLLPGEYIAFKNGHAPPITLDMIELRRRGDQRSNNASRIAQIQARIEELQAELDMLQAADREIMT